LQAHRLCRSCSRHRIAAVRGGAADRGLGPHEVTLTLARQEMSQRDE
jgi:hypothetical protein